MDKVTATVYFYTHHNRPPRLEIKQADDTPAILDFQRAAEQRTAGEICWVCRPLLPAHGSWQFRIDMGNQTYAVPFQGGSYDYFCTPLRHLWIQNGQIYSYEPAQAHVQPHVVKVAHFFGRLHRRSLYIYLPRGYHQHTFKRYPVLYMHDGQNVFEAFVDDSYAGSWNADKTATRLIANGQMQECIIVGVSNGSNDRIPEYLPPYVRFRRLTNDDGRHFRKLRGRADLTAQYYEYDVAAYIEQHYRALADREHRATCGSSMGGLFSTYLAWEQPHFAKHHAALSPSFWITGDPDDFYQSPVAIERLRSGEPRDIRLYLDSGTRTSDDHGDDGMHDTIAARDALLDNRYEQGDNLFYYLDEGATHTEAAWSKRLDRVFRFLLPARDETNEVKGTATG